MKKIFKNLDEFAKNLRKNKLPVEYFKNLKQKNPSNTGNIFFTQIRRDQIDLDEKGLYYIQSSDVKCFNDFDDWRDYYPSRDERYKLMNNLSSYLNNEIGMNNINIKQLIDYAEILKCENSFKGYNPYYNANYYVICYFNIKDIYEYLLQNEYILDKPLVENMMEIK